MISHTRTYVRTVHHQPTPLKEDLFTIHISTYKHTYVHINNKNLCSINPQCVGAPYINHMSTMNVHTHQCCGHYRGIIINYHCDYLSIKALPLPLPLRTTTKVINYHCNYISTIAITITNYRYILGCLQKLLYLTEISYM